MFSSGKASYAQAEWNRVLCPKWCRLSHDIGLDVGATDSQATDRLWIVVEKKRDWGCQKWQTVLKVEFQEKQTQRRRYVCRAFLGSALRVTAWESKSSTSRGRSQAAVQLVPDWCGLSELAQVMAKRPELHTSRWPVAGRRLPPGKRHSWGPVVFLPFSATPSEGMSPDISHPWSRSWGRSAEAGAARAVQRDWQLGVLPRWAAVRTWMPASEMREWQEADRVREDMDLLLNQCYLNTWKDVIPRGSERCQSRNHWNRNHSWWAPAKKEVRQRETREGGARECPT